MWPTPRTVEGRVWHRQMAGSSSSTASTGSIPGGGQLWDVGSADLRATQVVAGVVMVTTVLLMVAAGCGDDAGKSAETPPSQDTSTPAPPDTSTPAPPATNTPASPDRPVVNIQFIGAADLSDESKSSLADVVESIQASVVQIIAGSGSGSGFIVDEDGLVVTNEHVVDGARSVRVWLTNGRSYEGDVLERDETADLALVQIGGGGSFDGMLVGDPDRVRVGDDVLALGFPLADRIGTDLTVTRGIISSTRTVNGVELLQTDAAVNPGNSGGPLVNRDGEVIGVNTSRIEETDSGRPVDNIGFAVSVSELERRLPALGVRQLAALGTPSPTPAPVPTPEPTSTLALTPTPTITPTPTPIFTPTPPKPVSPFISVSSGSHYACGLRADGAVVCRGDVPSHWPFRSLGGARLTSISSSDTDTCGLLEDGVAVCWGAPSLLVPGSLLEDERFTSISIGRYHNCGLREDGVVLCWGSNAQGWSPPFQEGRFTSISTGWSETCALRADGVAVCWGLSSGGILHSPPEDARFISISNGHQYACGLREDGVVVCWGNDPPHSPLQDERFTSISTDREDGCGLREDGVAVCWGRSSPPEDERFTSISIGSSHACGLREDGTIFCWGRGLWDQFSPGDEHFISVSSGDSHTCGVREDGIIVCWGGLDWEDS